MSAVLLPVIGLFLLTNSQTAQECTDEHQCSNSNITNSEIACSGYYSCLQSTIISTDRQNGFINCTGMLSCESSPNLQSERNLYCTGFKSCYRTSKISGRIVQCSGTSSCDHRATENAEISADTLLYCGGQESCHSATLSSGKRTYCEGRQACSNTNINAGDTLFCDGIESCLDSTLITPAPLYCSGSGSCSGSTITSPEVKLYGFASGRNSRILGSHLIEAYGHQSLSDAIVSSMDEPMMTVKAMGEEAGNGAIVVCRSGATCSLICKNTGCAGLEYRCLAGSVCTLNPNQCTVSTDSSDPPLTSYRGISCPLQTDGTQQINEFQKDDNLDMDEQDDEGKVDAVDMESLYDISANTKNCNKDRLCAEDVINEGFIECTAFESCISANLANPGSSMIETVGCLAEDSCISANIYSPIGYASCLGELSCEQASIMASHVRCGGLMACQDATGQIKANGVMICGGTSSCKRSDIVNTEVTECTANRACYTSVISSDGGVICDGHYSCSIGDISSGLHVECTGKGSCNEAILNAKHRVFVDAHYGANKAIISADYVRGYGYHSLVFSTIDSEHREELVVHSYGHMAGYGASVICRSGSKCTLVCKASGCKNLDYLCMDGAVCILSPVKCRAEGTESHSGVECPNMHLSVSIDAEMQMTKRKKFNRINDEIYKKYRKEIQQDEEVFVALGYYDEDSEQELKLVVDTGDDDQLDEDSFADPNRPPPENEGDDNPESESGLDAKAVDGENDEALDDGMEDDIDEVMDGEIDEVMDGEHDEYDIDEVIDGEVDEVVNEEEESGYDIDEFAVDDNEETEGHDDVKDVDGAMGEEDYEAIEGEVDEIVDDKVLFEQDFDLEERLRSHNFQIFIGIVGIIFVMSLGFLVYKMRCGVNEDGYQPLK